MAKKIISRLYDFQPGDTIRSAEVDNEFNQLVEWLNKTMDPLDWDGVMFWVPPSRVKEPSWSPSILKDFLEIAHNPNGTIKATAVKDPNWTVTDLATFLSVAHHNDGMIKSSGIADPLMQAHNSDYAAHPYVKAFAFFVGG